MSARALLTKDDADRLARAAADNNCVIEVRRGDATITIRPSDMVDKADAARLSLEDWRKGKARRAGKGQGRAQSHG